MAIVNNPLVDVICHSGSPAFAYDYEKIIDLAKKNHKLIEINNHSFDVRKASIPNCRKIAEICKEKEVGIVVSSDAHITLIWVITIMRLVCSVKFHSPKNWL